MTLFNTVKSKLNEYGIEIYHIETIQEKKEKIFYTEDMVLFVNDDLKSISIAFQATTKPERVGNLTLIVAEVELSSENETFLKPNWLGDEVTGDIKYYNSMLIKQPYKNWDL